MQNARRFAGGTDKLVVAYDASLQVPNPDPMSISVWFRIASAPSGQQVLTQNAYSSSHYDGFVVEVMNGGLYFRIGTGGGTGGNNRKDFSASVTISNDVWHHVLAVFYKVSTSYTCDAWFDGVDASAAYSSGLAPTPGYSGNLPAWFGNGDEPAPFVGDLGGVAYWGAQLDGTDAAALYACGDPTSIESASVIAYWPIEGDSPETDDSGNGLDATVTGTTVLTADGPCAVSVPDAPTNPSATAVSSSQIDVAWDNVADETGYRVERSLNGSSGWTNVSGSLAADTTSYSDTGLSAGTTYYYRVFAFNAAGDSSASTTVNATTDASGNRIGGTGAIRRRGGFPR